MKAIIATLGVGEYHKLAVVEDDFDTGSYFQDKKEQIKSAGIRAIGEVPAKGQDIFTPYKNADEIISIDKFKAKGW